MSDQKETQNSTPLYLRTTPYGAYWNGPFRSLVPTQDSVFEGIAIYNPSNRPPDDDSDDDSLQSRDGTEDTYYEEIGDIIGVSEPLDGGSTSRVSTGASWPLSEGRGRQDRSKEQQTPAEPKPTPAMRANSKFYIPPALGKWLDDRDERLALGPIPQEELQHLVSGGNPDDGELEREILMVSTQFRHKRTGLSQSLTTALPTNWQPEEEFRTVEGLDIINGTEVVIHNAAGLQEAWFDKGFRLCGNTAVNNKVKFYYYEVEIREIGYLFTLGFKLNDEKFPELSITKQSTCEWALDCTLNRLTGPRGYSGRGGIDQAEIVLKRGTVIGCGIDFVNQVVFFTANGKRLSGDFQNINASGVIPFISVSFGNKIRANFGQYDFRYDVAQDTRVKPGLWPRLLEFIESRERPGKLVTPSELKVQKFAEKVCARYLKDRGYNSTLAAFTNNESQPSQEKVSPHVLWACVLEQLEQGKFVHVLCYLEQQVSSFGGVFEPSLMIHWLARCYIQLIEEKAPTKLIIELARVVTLMVNECELDEHAKPRFDNLYSFLVQPETARQDSWIRSKELDSWLSLRIVHKLRTCFPSELTSIEYLFFHEQSKLLTTMDPILGNSNIWEMGLLY